jgi:NitT/TauT family transport system substrate-binding protein
MMKRVAALGITMVLAIGSILAPSYALNAPSKKKTSSVIRIGFFPNVTHASALVAVHRKTFEKDLAKQGTKVEYVAFNAGPAAIEAMKAGSIDITFIGPNPAVAGYVSTKGSLLKIISGVTSGGAQFITKQSITEVSQLKGKTFATPQLGNTQDVALRAYLKANGFKTSVLGSGDVSITPTENSQTLALFKNGSIDGAWVPEPWASRLVLEANGRVFLDEKTIWPKGQFVTTHLIAKSDYLSKYSKTIRTVLNSLIKTNRWIAKNQSAAKEAVQAQLEKWSGKRLSDEVLNRAWPNITVTVNPVANSLEKSVDDAVEAGLLTNIGSRGIQGIYDLRILNKLLKSKKMKTVSSAGLGQQ